MVPVRLGDDAAGKDVGTGSNKGAGAAKYGCIGKGNQKLGGGLVNLAGQCDDYGKKNDNDRGVVHEPGDACDDKHHDQKEPGVTNLGHFSQ